MTSLPSFVTVNTTLPEGASVAESSHSEPVSVTSIVVAPLPPPPPAVPVASSWVLSVHAPASATTATSDGRSSRVPPRFICLSFMQRFLL